MSKKGMIEAVKRISALIICLLLISTVSSVYAVPNTDGWTFTKAQNTDGVLTLNAATFSGDEITELGGRIKTTSFGDMTSKTFIISLTSEGGGEQTLRLASSVQKSAEILKISNGNIDAFGETGVAVCDSDKACRITMAVDMSGEIPNTSIWVDGKLKYTGTFEGLSRVDMTKMYINMANDGREVWTVKDFSFEVIDGEFLLTMAPTEKAVLFENIDNISVDFGTRLGDVMYIEDSYKFLCDNAEADFSFESNDVSVTLTPDDGFEVNRKYSVTADIVGLFGEDLGELSIDFTVLPNNYAPPIITPQFDGENLDAYIEQNIPLTFSSDKELSKMDIYLDGELAASISQKPWRYILHKDTAWYGRIKAIGFDEYGISGESEEIYIEVKNNNPPQLQVSGIEDSGVYQAGTLPEISASATDENGISKIIFLVDGIVKETALAETATFSLSGLSGGVHKITIQAEDMLGLKTSRIFNVTLENSMYVEVFQTDFENYTGGGTIPTNMTGSENRGYLDAGTVKTEFGNSALIGMREVNASTSSGDGAWVGIPLNDAVSRVVAEFDMYIDKKPDVKSNGQTDEFRMVLKETGGAEMKLLSITKDDLNIFGGSYSYSEKEWYHIKADVNIYNKSINVTITGKDVNISAQGALSDMNVIHYLRIFGPVNDNVETYAAVDNVVVKHILSMPIISFEDNIESGTDTVTFNLSEELMLRDLKSEYISISDEFGGVVEIAEINADGTEITLTTSSPLKGGTRYIVTIDGKVRYASGSELGLAIVGDFTTLQGELSVVSEQIADSRMTLKISNQTGSEINAYAIAQTWFEGAAERVKIIPLTIAANSTATNYDIELPMIQEAEELTVYLWDGYINSIPLTSQIFNVK